MDRRIRPRNCPNSPGRFKETRSLGGQEVEGQGISFWPRCSRQLCPISKSEDDYLINLTVEAYKALSGFPSRWKLRQTERSGSNARFRRKHAPRRLRAPSATLFISSITGDPTPLEDRLNSKLIDQRRIGRDLQSGPWFIVSKLRRFRTTR